MLSGVPHFRMTVTRTLATGNTHSLSRDDLGSCMYISSAQKMLICSRYTPRTITRTGCSLDAFHFDLSKSFLFFHFRCAGSSACRHLARARSLRIDCRWRSWLVATERVRELSRRPIPFRSSDLFIAERRLCGIRECNYLCSQTPALARPSSHFSVHPKRNDE